MKRMQNPGRERTGYQLYQSECQRDHPNLWDLTLQRLLDWSWYMSNAEEEKARLYLVIHGPIVIGQQTLS